MDYFIFNSSLHTIKRKDYNFDRLSYKCCDIFVDNTFLIQIHTQEWKSAIFKF